MLLFAYLCGCKIAAKIGSDISQTNEFS